jgi:hypothetical protein
MLIKKKIFGKIIVWLEKSKVRKQQCYLIRESNKHVYIFFLRRNTNFATIWCSFKCILKIGADESIVNAPFVRLQNKNAKSEK